MDELVTARVIHVIAVLFWIGGVGFVTWVIIPTLVADELPENRLAKFHLIERRFAMQARIWVLLTGVSGFWLVYRVDLWDRFVDPRFWWMHAMVALWAIFAVMLFVLEPLVLHRRMASSFTPEADFRRLVRLHHTLIGLALIVLFGAVGGSHGLF